MSQQMNNITASFQAMAEKMNNNKFIKASKELNSSFKSMVDAIPGIGALSGLLMQLVDATGILKPFEAVFQLILGLFGVMGAQIIPVLMAALLPLMQLLVSLTPVFVVMGQVIGVLLSIGLIPFTVAIQLLTAVITPFLPLFEAITPILAAMQPAIQLFADTLSAILVPIMLLGSPLGLLVTQWDTLSTVFPKLLEPLGVIAFKFTQLGNVFDFVGDKLGGLSNIAEDTIDDVVDNFKGMGKKILKKVAKWFD